MSTNSISRGNDVLPLIAASGDISHQAHTVQFYGEDTFLLDELSRFIGTALGAGDAAIVIATKAHRDGLAQRLQARGLDAARAAKEGRYVAIDAAETLAKFMRDGWPDAALFTEVVGSELTQAALAAEGMDSRISAFGEMVALLWAEGNAEAAVRLEELWNELARNYSLSLRCAYPMSGFDREYHSDSFLKICEEHSHVIPVESYTALINEEQRLRSISHLQQKAQALENEMAERKQVEEMLRHSKAELESQVEQRTSALRRLSSRLLSLQDTERRRIARELHDSLGQYLVGLKLNVHMLRQSPDREELWSQAEELMQQCMNEVRTLSYLLHPPTMDAAGFASAARWYVEGFGQRSGLQVTLDAPKDLGRLPDAFELALFRVLQEALTNVHRHSGASAANILVRGDAEQVILEVKDNGRGMPPELLTRFRATGEGVGVGLAGIGERVRELGGKLKIESNGSGTLVRVAIPIPTDHAK
ncbi:MAG TPA: MEDS domain-containing protein [Terriglobales bacterium]|jgi:signal transduction histidine kinase|nr:MEDS domain-containing protein [Terriglobales bacterium]